MAEEEHAREVDLIDAPPHASRPPITSQLLLVARMLIGSSPESNATRGPLSGILSQRLMKAKAEFSELSFPTGYEFLSIEQLQSTTGYAALKILEAVDAALLVDAANQEAGVALLGTRDTQVLRTTASLVFHWALDPILKRLSGQWKDNPPKQGVAGGPDVQEAAALLKRLHGLLHQESTRTPASDILAGDYSIETLRGLLVLGWLPPGVCSESGLLRTGAMKLLGSASLDTSIQRLGSALSRALPPHARTAATYLLSRRLMHPQGIRALFYSTFDEDIAGDTMQRFDAVSQLLSLPPKGINNEEYLRAVIPRLVHILQDTESPITHHRAAAYCMAHMLDSAVSQASSNILFPIFHGTFTFGKRGHSESSLSPLASVTTLSRLLTALPPTSGVPFVLRFVSPILAPLYSLVAYLDRTPTAEPSVRASARSLFDAWAKLVPTEDGVLLLWSVVDGCGGDWELVDDGDCGLVLSLVQRLQNTHILLSELNGLIDGDLNANPLDLRPDPTHFIELLNRVGRKELSSLFFVHLLDAYKEYSAQFIEEQDPTRALLLLQLLHHMQSCADSSAFLSRLERILPFIDYALQGRPSEHGHRSRSIGEGPVHTLRFVRDEDGEEDDDHGDMMRTAVNLLLSLFEANPQFKPSPATTPIVRIATRLDELTVHKSLALRQAAREARLVLTVRQAEAEGSTAANSIQVTGDDPAELARQRTRDTYQEALHLLQDPLLPVRAHGLSLLRHLIAGQSAAAEAENVLDPALAPAILDIFLQSAQEEDSYIFLNAVQGLSLMAENSQSGRAVFSGLLRIYTGNRDNAGDLNRTELDLRLRIGEAISEVLRRTGPSLGNHADHILPSLLLVIRDPQLPTTLRMSAISLLSRCIDAAPVAMSSNSHEIGEAMLDLLQLETVATVEKKKDEKPTATAMGQDGHHPQDAASSYAMSKHIVQAGDIAMDSDPLQSDAKLSPLRRSAIHLLTVLVKVLLDQVHESGVSGVHGSVFSAERGLITLRYIATTDADNTVRVLAAEAADLLGQLRWAMLGVGG